MFRHQMCHPQGTSSVTLLNYISKIAAVAKINLLKPSGILYVPPYLKFKNSVC